MQAKGSSSIQGADQIHFAFLKPTQLRGLTRAGHQENPHLLHPVSREGASHEEMGIQARTVHHFSSFL